MSTHGVFDRHLRATRDLEAHRVRLARVKTALHLVGISIPPSPIVLRVLSLQLRLSALGLQLLRRAEAGVRMSLVHQLLREPLVHARLHPLGLAVRPLLPPYLGPFVPQQPEPPQVFQHALLGLTRAPRGVGVLDAHEEVASRLPGREPREERGACAAHVERAGGRRGEPRPHAPRRAQGAAGGGAGAVARDGGDRVGRGGEREACERAPRGGDHQAEEGDGAHEEEIEEVRRRA
mmetsp:Transcript_37771/g.93891  ORF Transcript_37771/g.93891 Transcript_37771/m.93891 type:complete len:235 (-) Transcript_37771:6-710(-)